MTRNRIVPGGDLSVAAGRPWFNVCGVVAMAAVAWLVPQSGGLGDTYKLDPGFTVPAFNDMAYVTGCVLQPDDSVLIAGSFAAVNFRPADRLVRILPNGTVDEAYRPPLEGNSVYVSELFPLRNGQVVVSTASGSTHEFWRLNADGTRDVTFRPEVDPGGTTHLAEAADGTIVVVGRLSIDSPVARMARDGKRLAMSFPFPPAADYYLEQVMARQNGTFIILGKKRNDYSSPSQPFMAQIKADGSVDPGFDTRAFTNLIRGLLIETADQKLVFCSNSPESAPSAGTIERADADGTLDPTFHPFAMTSGYVDRISLLGPTNIAVLGNFLTDGRPEFARSIFVLNPDGTVRAGVAFPNWLRALAVGGAGDLLVQKSDPSSALTRIDPDGHESTSFAPVFLHSLGSRVLSATIAGVAFAGVLPSSGAGEVLHEVFVDGTLNRLWERTDLGLMQGVTAVATDNYYRIYSAGVLPASFSFRTQDLVRFHANGQMDETFGHVPVLSSWGEAVSVIHPLNDGLLIGGSFNQAADRETSKLARLQGDGRVDETFDCGDLLEKQFSFVRALLVQADGAIRGMGQRRSP